ncbi:arabinofuranosidase catalytic domain-containing protein [Cellulomonas sp. RIT-PI-Y]|uniref:arabinofuranosidase catalytic domain-containing protein n=1 Tax=Cellulomonas sp. RIT-PI-Y TaxID=3035297 RepID=UPI0021DAA8A1|nr:arabinofuranosidase catalytic domain-containing protein [Cellulomonas sp. RIT-PI-Y]
MRTSTPSARRRRLVAALSTVALVVGLAVPLLTTTAAPAQAATDGPCDIYAAGNTPCVAAYSPVRALFAAYNGPLYQVKRASDGATLNIGVISAGGVADAAAQDAFCAGTTCTVPVLYDQTSRHNHLTPAPAGEQGAANSPANAAALPITVNGAKAYGLYLPPGVAYRRSSTITSGTARGASPESMYEVASGTNVNSACCSDFGNVETDTVDTGAGHMDTLNVSTLGATGATGHGPWVQADLEEGVFQGKTAVWTPNQGNRSKFVTAVLKNNGVDTFALKGGDSQAGALSTWYDGALPDGVDRFGSTWKPMKLEGSVGLGAGGDNSNRGTQSFFEGAMTTGYASNATENAVQANIVAQHYDGVSTGGGPGRTIVGPGGKCVDVAGDDTAANLAVVQLWDCRTLAADQHWSGSIIGEGTLSTRGRCLDVNGNVTTLGTGVELYDCNGVAGQQWIPQADGTIKNPASGLCLDAPNGATANGTALRIWTCNASAAQQFSITTPILHPVSGAASKCVDVAGDDLDVQNQRVQLWTCQNVLTGAPGGRAESLDQQWTYRTSDQSVRTLGRCLDVIDNSTALGAGIQLHDCNGVGGQHWVPQADGSLRNPASGYCLDAPDNATANGTLLRTWTCNGAAAQKFVLN